MKKHNFGILMTLVASGTAGLLFTQSCGKKGEDTVPAITATPTATPTATASPTPIVGVSLNDGVTIKVGGSFAKPTTSLALTTDTPDTVMAIPIDGGDFQFKKSTVTSAVIAADGSFSLNLKQKSLESQMIDTSIKSDNTLNRTAFDEIYPEGKSMSDADILQHLLEMKTERGSNPEAYERTYVMVAYKSSGDKIKEAESMTFIGMPTTTNPLLGLPITKAKGNLDFGSISTSSGTAVTTLKADTTSFDLSIETLAQMTNLNDALKTLKNLYVNTDLTGGTSIEITPTFTWEAAIAKATSTIYDTAKDYTYKGYSSYIAPRGFKATDLSLTKACHATESQRLIFSLTPPKAQTKSDGQVINTDNPLTNKGALNSALKTENGGSRQSCSAGSSYFAGGQDTTDGLEQIGMGLDFPGIAPDGWWTLTKDSVSFAKFDIGLSNPVASDNSIKVFIPKLTYETTNDSITKIIIKFDVWDANKKAYVELTDLSTFKRIITEFGVSLSIYNNSGGSNEVGGAKPSSIINNSYVITKFIDQGEKEVTLPDPKTNGRFMIYYRAFGNSYNFFWK